MSAEEAKWAAEAQALDQSKLEPLTAEQLRRIDEAAPTTVITICKGQRIPDGMVIVGEGSSVSCPGSFPNVWHIKRPGPSEVVCSISPIPGNYVIVGQGSSVSCPGNFPNTRTIRRV